MITHQSLNNITLKSMSKVIWFGIQASVPVFIVILVLMDQVIKFEPVVPALKPILIGLCIISIPAPFVILNRFKRKQLEISNNIQLGMSSDTKNLQRYLSLLIIGLSLCNLTAAFGLILYIISGEIELSIFFIIVSLLLGFLYKPALK